MTQYTECTKACRLQALSAVCRKSVSSTKAQCTHKHSHDAQYSLTTYTQTHTSTHTRYYKTRGRQQQSVPSLLSLESWCCYCVATLCHISPRFTGSRSISEAQRLWLERGVWNRTQTRLFYQHKLTLLCNWVKGKGPLICIYVLYMCYLFTNINRECYNHGHTGVN